MYMEVQKLKKVEPSELKLSQINFNDLSCSLNLTQKYQIIMSVGLQVGEHLLNHSAVRKPVCIFETWMDTSEATDQVQDHSAALHDLVLVVHPDRLPFVEDLEGEPGTGLADQGRSHSVVEVILDDHQTADVGQDLEHEVVLEAGQA